MLKFTRLVSRYNQNSKPPSYLTPNVLSALPPCLPCTGYHRARQRQTSQVSRFTVSGRGGAPESQGLDRSSFCPPPGSVRLSLIFWGEKNHTDTFTPPCQWKFIFFNQLSTHTVGTQLFTLTVSQILQLRIIRKCSQHSCLDLSYITHSI